MGVANKKTSLLNFSAHHMIDVAVTTRLGNSEKMQARSCFLSGQRALTVSPPPLRPLNSYQVDSKEYYLLSFKEFFLTGIVQRPEVSLSTFSFSESVSFYLFPCRKGHSVEPTQRLITKICDQAKYDNLLYLKKYISDQAVVILPK